MKNLLLSSSLLVLLAGCGSSKHTNPEPPDSARNPAPTGNVQNHSPGQSKGGSCKNLCASGSAACVSFRTSDDVKRSLRELSSSLDQVKNSDPVRVQVKPANRKVIVPLYKDLQGVLVSPPEIEFARQAGRDVVVVFRDPAKAPAVYSTDKAIAEKFGGKIKKVEFDKGNPVLTTETGCVSLNNL